MPIRINGHVNEAPTVAVLSVGAPRPAIIAVIVTSACVLSGSAHALDLGGTDVPKERTVVYLFMGHSNMSGRQIPSDEVTHPRAGANPRPRQLDIATLP